MGRLKPCIGLLEFSSIAAGYEATDAAMKEAPIEVLLSRPVSPGKHLLLVTGEVDEVKSALAKARSGRLDALLDELVLPNAHPDLATALAGPRPARDVEAVGLVETLTVATAIVGADIAVKRASVHLLCLVLANVIGGKAYFAVAGETSNVESAVASAAEFARERAVLARTMVLPSPDPRLLEYLVAYPDPAPRFPM